MDERLQFVARRLDGKPMATLCEEFGISRKTGYKLFERPTAPVGQAGEAFPFLKRNDASQRPFQTRTSGTAQTALRHAHSRTLQRRGVATGASGRCVATLQNCERRGASARLTSDRHSDSRERPYCAGRRRIDFQSSSAYEQQDAFQRRSSNHPAPIHSGSTGLQSLPIWSRDVIADSAEVAGRYPSRSSPW